MALVIRADPALQALASPSRDHEVADALPRRPGQPRAPVEAAALSVILRLCSQATDLPVVRAVGSCPWRSRPLGCEGFPTTPGASPVCRMPRGTRPRPAGRPLGPELFRRSHTHLLLSHELWAHGPWATFSGQREQTQPWPQHLHPHFPLQAALRTGSYRFPLKTRDPFIQETRTSGWRGTRSSSERSGPGPQQRPPGQGLPPQHRPRSGEGQGKSHRINGLLVSAPQIPTELRGTDTTRSAHNSSPFPGPRPTWAPGWG